MLPDSARDKQHRGTVVAVGPGRVLSTGERTPLHVEVGDSIVFGDYSGQTVEVEGEEYLILSEQEILAVVRD